jgi:hypothetical protein
MNPSSEKEQLSDLLKKVDNLEAKKRQRLLLATALPIIVAAGLLYYFITRIAKAKNHVSNLHEQVHQLRKESDSLSNVLTDLKKAAFIYNRAADSFKGVYDNLSFNFREDFGWSDKELIIKSRFTKQQGKEAHDSIISFLKSGRVNTGIAIRYYTKKLDNGIIDNTIKKCGFRTLYIFTSSYNDSTSTNAISYSSGVTENDIKLIAYSLLRAGAELKSIEPFSRNSEAMGKENSIEILSKSEYLNRKTLTMNDIKRFAKRKSID